MFTAACRGPAAYQEGAPCALRTEKSAQFMSLQEADFLRFEYLVVLVVPFQPAKQRGPCGEQQGLLQGSLSLSLSSSLSLSFFVEVAQLQVTPGFSLSLSLFLRRGCPAAVPAGTPAGGSALVMHSDRILGKMSDAGRVHTSCLRGSWGED